MPNQPPKWLFLPLAAICAALVLPGTVLADSILKTRQDQHEAAETAPAPDQIQQTPGAKVLLIQDIDPWERNSNKIVLDNLGEIYDVVGSQSFPTVDLNNYKTIVIASDQPPSFYRMLKSHRSRVNTWLLGGARTLQFNGADQGWGKGKWSVVLPLRVSRGGFYSSLINKVVNESSPLVAGVSLEFAGTSASHTYFANAPEGSVIVRDEMGNPTLIDYCYGKSRVIATGLTLEYAYFNDQGAGPILVNSLTAATKTPGCQTP